MNLYLLDFDGVIASSVDEAIVSAYNGYMRMKEDNKIYDIDNVPKDILERGRRWRPKLKGMFDWYKIFEKTDEELESVESLDDIKMDEGEVDRFTQLTADFRKKHFDVIKDLIKIYPGMKDAYTQKFDSGIVYIISNKDKSSILNILQANDMPYTEKRILDYTHGPKLNRVKRAIEETKPEKSFFIDDFVDTLIKVKKALPQVQCILAGWGYVDEEALVKAKEHDIPVLKELNL